MPSKSNDKKLSSLKTDFNKIIDIEIGSIKSSLSLQRYMQNTLMSVSDRLWNTLNSSSNIDLIHDSSKDLYEISNFSFKIQDNIHSLEKLETKLELLNLSTTNLENSPTFSKKIDEYHKEINKLIEQALEFNSTFNVFLNKISENTILSSLEDNNNNTTDTKINIDTLEAKKVKKTKNSKSKRLPKLPDDFKENTLIISNTEVILPFTKKDLEDKFENSDLTSYEEIIDTFYKRSAKSFEPSSISRFKEAYSLIIDKEHGSKFQAISLAIELSTNYNLHPAIIAACKNSTQLDVYLSCLEYKELDDFHFFDIVYNVSPIPKKQLFKKFIENT